MDSNSENIDDAKSKIEKIRIDLEKKLAALEAAKIKTAQKGIPGGDIIEEVVINETISEKGIVNENSIEEININKENEIDKDAEVEVIKNESIVEDKNIVETNKVEDNKNFIEQISSIEDANIVADNIIVENSKVNNENISDETHSLSDNNNKLDVVEINVSNEDTFFEINDVIEEVADEVVIIKDNVVEENNDKKIIPVSNEIKQQEKSDAVVAVVPNIEKTVPKKEVVTKKEKEEKKSRLGFLIYALGAITIFVLGYLTWNYMKNNQSGNDDADRLMSEYKNRIYKDSIELADTNNQFLDFQKRYIDSIALANEIEIKSSPNTQKPKSVFANKAKKNVAKKTNPTFVNNTSVINDPITNPVTLQKETVVNAANDLSVSEKTEETITPEEITKVEEKIEEPIKKPKPKTETLTSIEKSPVYPGCEKKTSEFLKKKCLMSKIQKFVANKFNSDLTQDLGLDGGRKKINVSFIIDRFGNVNVLRVRAQHKALEKEAIRVVNALPKMKPGRKNGKSEPVIYNLPIIYSVEY